MGSGIQRLLDSALEGYRCSVLAYGATSSGKTHTMVGGDEGQGQTRGLFPRAVDYIFSKYNKELRTLKVR